MLRWTAQNERRGSARRARARCVSVCPTGMIQSTPRRVRRGPVRLSFTSAFAYVRQAHPLTSRGAARRSGTPARAKTQDPGPRKQTPTDEAQTPSAPTHRAQKKEGGRGSRLGAVDRGSRIAIALCHGVRVEAGRRQKREGGREARVEARARHARGREEERERERGSGVYTSRARRDERLG